VRRAGEKGMDILEEIKRLDAVAFGELCRRAANEDNLGARLVEGISIEIMASDGGLIEEQMNYVGEF
jgi:hypothetical protein